MSRYKSNQECPVPINQQPYNELKSLKESYTFAWTAENVYLYCRKLLQLTIGCILFTIPFVTGIVSLKTQPLEFINLVLVITSSILTLILVRSYLGWSYVSRRLLSASIVYEESGWYDGQIWVKTSEELTRDRLLGQYTVRPILKRIKKTILFLTSIGFVNYLIYTV